MKEKILKLFNLYIRQFLQRLNELTTENQPNPFSILQYSWKVKAGYVILLTPTFSHEIPKSKLHCIQTFFKNTNEINKLKNYRLQTTYIIKLLNNHNMGFIEIH